VFPSSCSSSIACPMDPQLICRRCSFRGGQGCAVSSW
jgi:hypothetical protein